jgi:hypothetical protein
VKPIRYLVHFARRFLRAVVEVPIFFQSLSNNAVVMHNEHRSNTIFVVELVAATLPLSSRTMKSVVFASLVASAAAFAPPQHSSRSSSTTSTSLNEFVRGYVGADNVEPMLFGSSKNFDPLGLAEVRAYGVMSRTFSTSKTISHALWESEK